MSNDKNNQWKRLNISKGTSSYGQERIWLDENIRHSTISTNKDQKMYNYNSVLVYKVDDGYLSIDRFRRALDLVIDKHEIFRTSLKFDIDERYLQQTINQPSSDCYSYELTFVDVNDIAKLNQIIYHEEVSEYFDLDKGKIFRCHLLKQNHDENTRLIRNDIILLVFHHLAIDHHSKYLFLKELKNAYEHEKLDPDNDRLRYIDYSQYERKLDLSASENFWHDLFFEYNFDQQLRLPYDSHLKFTWICSFYSFHIDKSLTRQIFRYKTKRNVNLFRLFLSTFFVYLFKLTQETDICITGVTQNRYRSELNNIIGPFENYIVYRCQLDPKQSFNQFIETIEKLCSNIKDNALYPYQQWITYARKFSSLQYPFSQIAVRLFIDDQQWNFDIENNLVLKQISLADHQLFPRETKLSPFDLILNIKCYLEEQTIQFYFEYSNKSFEQETIQTLAERFQKLLKHLFDVSSNFDLDEEPIYKLSIILPREERIMDNINVKRD